MIHQEVIRRKEEEEKSNKTSIDDLTEERR
jgi:hypothetical protein